MKGIPAHARSEETAQRILGSSCAHVQLADDGAVVDPDDERELFVETWCAHPDLVPNEKIMAVPEKEGEHDGGPPLFLRPEEIIHDEAPAMRYLVRLRVVEYQDWHTPPPSDDDDYRRRDNSDSDSGDSNYNGYWPGFCDCGGAGARPRTSRFDGERVPRLGRGAGPAFRPRGAACVINVGQVACPVKSLDFAPGSRIPVLLQTRVKGSMGRKVDLGPCADRSLSPVKTKAQDPMCVEALLCSTSKAAVVTREPLVQAIDCDPRANSGSFSCSRGTRARSIQDDHARFMGRPMCTRAEVDGPAFLFDPSCTAQEVHRSSSCMEIDLYSSGPDTGPSSPARPLPVDIATAPAATSPVHAIDVDGILDRVATAEPHAAQVSVDDFIASFKKPLEQSLLNTPQLRVTKEACRDEDLLWVPRRSARLAANSRYRENKPDAQARKVLMKKLGYEVDTERPDEASFDELHEAAFQVALTGEAAEAMQVLFPGRRQQVLRPATAV